MRRQVIATAMAAVCALAMTGLTGCSDESTAAPPPTTQSTPTTTATSPTTAPPPTTTAPTPTLPVIPSQARQKSVAGAKAFVRFYFDAINASWHARSGAVLRRYSTPDCISCGGLASSMDKIRTSNGFYRGGEWIVTYTTPIPLQRPTQPIINAAIDVKPGSWKRSPSDHLRIIRAEKMHVDVHLTWSGGWLVTSMVLA